MHIKANVIPQTIDEVMFRKIEETKHRFGRKCLFHAGNPCLHFISDSVARFRQILESTRLQ